MKNVTRLFNKGSMTKFFTSSLAALFCASSSVVAQDQAAEVSPVEVDTSASPVNLTGLAKLKFNPEQDRLEDWHSLRKSWEPEFLLQVRQDGQPVRCEVIAHDIDEELGTRLCTDLLLSSRVEIWPGISLGGRNGIISVNKQPYTQLQGIRVAGGRTASPFVFATDGLAQDEYLEYAPLSEEEQEGVRDDPTKVKSVKRPPRYPQTAITQRLEGQTRMVLEVAMDGSIQSCRPFVSSGTALLDAESCKYVLENIVFEPMQGVIEADAPFYHAVPMTWRLNR